MSALLETFLEDLEAIEDPIAINCDDCSGEAVLFIRPEGRFVCLQCAKGTVEFLREMKRAPKSIPSQSHMPDSKTEGWEQFENRWRY